MAAAQLTTWLVTGASRGIGLELVKQILATPTNKVVATCRNPDGATGLTELKDSAQDRLDVVRLDLDDFEAVRSSASQLNTLLGETGLDYLVNNAGISLRNELASETEPEDILQHVRTNAAAPALLSKICLPLLRKGNKKAIIHISSTAGSVNLAIPRVGAKITAYSMSKAALNMLANKQKAENPDFTVLCLCPGWVRTGLGGPAAPLEAPQSVEGLMKIIAAATPEDGCRFVRYNGDVIPW
ncbi:NAD-P-binding protein [Trametes coccinea BRFM310]|uniref:NAD-P-binding protein n=1 Tax=Trametes coccinea (strain BRFM310) TaxID=1353009 RepID=A0A1Y2IWH6_TRAC3|nr:NAD-P-binding protein [Trametes coccinea BRFM310]